MRKSVITAYYVDGKRVKKKIYFDTMFLSTEIHHYSVTTKALKPRPKGKG